MAVAPDGEIWRDNLDENGAAIRMRAGGRENRNNYVEPGAGASPFDGAILPSWGCRVSIATGRGKLQVQSCPQCPVSDGRPEKGGLS